MQYESGCETIGRTHYYKEHFELLSLSRFFAIVHEAEQSMLPQFYLEFCHFKQFTSPQSQKRSSSVILCAPYVQFFSSSMFILYDIEFHHVSARRRDSICVAIVSSALWFILHPQQPRDVVMQWLKNVGAELMSTSCVKVCCSYPRLNRRFRWELALTCVTKFSHLQGM